MDDSLVKIIASQYQNQGLAFSELLEVSTRGLKKAEKKTQGLKNEEKKKSQMVWFIRQEILNEIKEIKSS